MWLKTRHYLSFAVTPDADDVLFLSHRSFGQVNIWYQRALTLLLTALLNF